MNPDNAIMGDNTGVDLPQSTPDDDLLIEEKKMAKYSRSKEFERLKEHFEARIAYYQQFLPDGRTIDQAPTSEQWVIANEIIKEFNLVISTYEMARNVVDG